MNAPESLIVSITCADYDIELDAELPSGLVIKELRVKILDILKSLYAEEFEAWYDCKILYNYRILKDDETLADAGTCDGQYLEIMKS